MLNAALAILTTEYEPNMEYMQMYDKVKTLAAKIAEDDKPSDPPSPLWAADEDMRKAFFAGWINSDAFGRIKYESPNGNLPGVVSADEWLTNYKKTKNL
jgi:hypothetical protein